MKLLLSKKKKRLPKKGIQQETRASSQPAQSTQSVSGQSQSSSGSGYGASQTGGYGSASIETVEIHGDDPGWSDNEYAHEFFRYYTEPPGFKDKEQISITVEICDGKAIAFSPRGSEPLILYTAAKDAILKMRFARRSFVEKKVFII